MIEEFAFQNADNVVSIRDPHKPTDKIKELLKESKNNVNKIVIYERDDGSKLYFYNGGSLAFYSNKIREINGEKHVTELLTDFWDHISWAGIANEGRVKLKNGKKPEKLIKQLIELTCERDESEIILDFNSGSGTTSAVAHKMGYQYIGIEQLDYGDNDSVKRLNNVIRADQTGVSKSVGWQGGGSFIFCELMQYNEAFMDRIQYAETSDELVEIWKDIAENSFINWYVNHEMPEDAVNDFIEIGKSENGLEKQKRLLAELLNKNQLYVNLSEIHDEQFRVSDEDKELNSRFYGEMYGE